MQPILRLWLEDESGATAIEYGLILGLISVIIISAVTAVEHSIEGKYNLISNTLK